MRSISLSAQRIPSVHSFYRLHALYLATLNLTVWQHGSPLPLSMHQGNEWFSVMRLCLQRNPCAHAESKFLGIIHLMMNHQEFFAEWTLVRRANFGRHSLATSAATRCVRVAWTLIDAAECYDCCPTQLQTRPIEILWISVAQAGLTHQQNGNLSGPPGELGWGYIKGRCEETGDPWPLPPAAWPWKEISVSALRLKSSSLDQFDDV